MVVVLAILATIGTMSYAGYRKSAAKVVVLDDLRQAADAVELSKSRNNGYDEFTNNSVITGVSDSFRPSPQVVTRIYLQASNRYNNLTAVQNAVLFQAICSNLSNDKRPDAPDLVYGQGRNQVGGEVKFLWGPSLCNVYGKDNIQFNTSWSFAGGQLNAPVSKSNFQNFINSINNSDSYFPDATYVAKQYYQQVLERFENQGGTFPITTFWDGDWCKVGQAWCVAKEPLPSIAPVSSDGYFCLESYHQNYPDMVYRISSDNRSPEPGRC